MKRSMWQYVVIAIFYIVFLSVGIMLLRLNFSNSDFFGGDLIYMFPMTTWFYLMFLPIGLLLIRKLDKRLSVIIPFTFAVLFLVAFDLIQYPSIFFWDTFRHSATAQYVVTYSSFAADAGYHNYPGTFFISAILSEVLGLPVLLTNLFFGAFLNLSIVFSLLMLGRVFFGTEPARSEMSWLGPSIFLAFSFRLYVGNHFSPQLFGLLLYIFFVYVCFKALFVRNRACKILLLILLIALTTIHLFSAVVASATLICIHFLGGKARLLKLNNKQFVTRTILLTSIIVLVSWHFFLATGPIEETLDFLPAVLRGERPISGFVEAVVFSPISGLNLFLLTLYRYGIYGLVAFTSGLSVLLFRRKIEIKLLCIMSIGLILSAIAVYLTPATFGVGRILFYAGVIVSVLSSYLILAKRHSKSLTFNWIIRILNIIIPFLVIGTFLVSNLYYSTYVSFVHQDEMQSAQFVAEHVRTQISVEITQSLLIPFYTNVSIPMRVIRGGDNSTIVENKIQESDLSLQYLPKLLYYFNLSFIDAQSNLVYSNGFSKIYAKTNPQGGS